MDYALLVTGDRNWSDKDVIQRALRQFPAGTFMINGACRGADVLAAAVGEDLGFAVVNVPYITRFGRGGGPARNKKMLTLLLGLKASGYWPRVYAFHSNLAVSKGTKSMVDLARKAGLDVEVIPAERGGE